MGFLDRVKKVAESTSSSSGNEAAASAVELTAHERKIEDVLEVLQIPATFEIPDDVFLPEDIKDVSFDVQVPHGFDEGQVTYFVGQARNSIRFFTQLLRKRNEDVAKLASVIDKLQVDANNLRFENEIAQGISVMPTVGDEDLETQLMEAKLKIVRLEEQLKTSAPASGLPVPAGDTVPQAAYEKVSDELSIMRRKNEALEEEVYTLKSRLALLDDEADDELAPLPTETPLSPEEYLKLGVVLPEPQRNDYDGGDDFSLPDASVNRPFDPVLPLPVETLTDELEDFNSLDPSPPFGGHDGNPRTFSVYDDDNEESFEDLLRNIKGEPEQ